eukprot:TRINITY_DN14080_c0_g2_i1.p1 TRINITY_DN14080_c0_g2~~TRINITY_DN14080_c0_g2_i1.p1  ORF type:complete len:831 (+),score=120.40 TRINITY_DN14080_c0_g2_i1:24-2516(+)
MAAASGSPVLLFAASMTALLLLLSIPSALCAPASAGCFEGDGACPGSSRSLLQSSTKLSLEHLTLLQQDKDSMHSFGVISDEVVDELHARAEAMVQNGQALTPLERTTLNALNKTLSGMLPALQDGHTEDQAEIDAAVQFISNCNKNFDADARAAKTAKGEVNTSQKEHAVCRGKQNKLKVEAVKTSGELDKFWKPLVLPQKPALASNTFVNNLEQWVRDHKKSLAEKISKNTTAHDDLTKKAAECDSKQSVLESGFCQWFGRATAANKSYARCWAQSGSTFTKLKKEALASAEGRKFQYVAIHKIQCYMEVIFLPSRKRLHRCKNLSLDTSGFDLTNTAAEPQKDVAGELDPMDSKPGDESWKQSVYAGVSGVADVTPCAVAHSCDSDKKVLAHRCLACEPGKTNQAGDNALGPNTNCTAVLCSSNEYVSSNSCKSCAAGTENAAYDDASGADTSCTAILCQAGQRVQNNSCHSCPAGSKNTAGGHDASGADTSCDAIKCGADHYVQSNACHTCPVGKTRTAGDDATKGDTTCDATLCKANQKVVSNKCKGCPPGKTNVAGDDASVADSICDPIICTANQRVVGNACIACPDGTTRPAGDDASGRDTTCKPTLCPGNHFVNSKACKPCPAGQINDAGDDASGADTICKAGHSGYGPRLTGWCYDGVRRAHTDRFICSGYTESQCASLCRSMSCAGFAYDNLGNCAPHPAVYDNIGKTPSGCSFHSKYSNSVVTTSDGDTSNGNRCFIKQPAMLPAVDGKWCGPDTSSMATSSPTYPHCVDECSRKPDCKGVRWVKQSKACNLMRECADQKTPRSTLVDARWAYQLKDLR